MKLLFGLLSFVSIVVAQTSVQNLAFLQSSSTTNISLPAQTNKTSLLDIFNTKTEKFREVYNHQLELLEKNLTGNRFIIKFRDSETVEEEDEESTIPFFKWMTDLKQQKFEKIKSIKARGLDKMKDKLNKWNLTGTKEQFYGTQTGVNIVQVDKGQDMESIWSTILLDSDVEFAEVDMSLSTLSDCQLLSDWGYRHTRANYANDVLQLASPRSNPDAQVLVAVIDSGVDYDHPLLAGRVWINEAELNGADGVDDDGNGYIDDIWGWNFGGDNNDVKDFDGHGTHVAGIIAGAETNDPDTFAGVAPNVMILPCRFTDSSDSGTVSSAIQCIEYGFEMNVDIFSNSWGGVGAYSFALEQAMNRANHLGRLQINAAGNSAADNDGSREEATFPAAYDTDIIISVAAIDNNGQLTQVSNYGASSVDIGAPGESIWSTQLNGELQRMSGTSQATPYVAAAAAMLLGACRDRGMNCSAMDIKDAIINGAVRDSDLTNRVLSSGFLDIPNAARILGLVNNNDLLDRDEEELDVCRGQKAGAVLVFVVCALIAYFIVFTNPPFQSRGRRGSCRGRRPPCGMPPFGPSGRFQGPRFGFPFNGQFFNAENLEVDLEDVGFEYCFTRTVPGIAPENLHVEIQGSVLTVRTLTEIPGQRFKWHILVPEDVERDAISAEVDNGMLKVRFPKRSARVIPVTSSTTSNTVPQSAQNRTSDLWQLENWGSEYRLTHPAPGCRPNEVLVDVEEGFIFVRCQGRDGRFSGEFNLPPGVDIDSIMVEIVEGVLTVTLPKLERRRLRIQCRGTDDDISPSAPVEDQNELDIGPRAPVQSQNEDDIGPSAPVQDRNDDGTSVDEDDALYNEARLV
eukprot:g3660.t1